MTLGGRVIRRVGVGALALTIQMGPALLIWGGWKRYSRNPARRTLALISVGGAVSAAVNGLNLSRGQRGVQRQRIAVALLAGGIVLGRVLSPLSDRYDRLVLPGGGLIRWLGVLVTGLGGALFESSRTVMGRQYSFMAAIQSDHKLVTNGPYRWVRHPGYAGLIFFQLGYALIFRSLLGLASLVPLVSVLLWRIADEEALLVSEFGEQYERYRQRSARFIPYVY